MSTTSQDIHFRIEDLQPIVAPYATVRPFSGVGATVNFVESEAGAVLEHSHPHEQITVMQSGRMRMVVDGREPFEVGAGEIVYLASHAHHRCEVLEDTVCIDVFNPVQEDLMRMADEARAAQAS